MTLPGIALPGIALATGPYDWHPERIPRSVYDARLEAVRTIMRARAVTHLVVHGSVFDHGALAWLTHFTPKLGPAYALIPADGPAKLLFSGGPTMRPSAQRLTWLEDVTALKGICGDLGRWLGQSAGPIKLGIVEGSAMSRGDWTAVQDAARQNSSGETNSPPQRAAVRAGERPDDRTSPRDSALAITPPPSTPHPGRGASQRPEELDADINALRRAKTPLELELIRRAALCLTQVTDLLANLLPHAGIVTAALAAEARGYAAGAQDIRLRIGTTPWGPPVPLGRDDIHPDGPIRVAASVRHAGYWVHGAFVAGELSGQLRRLVRLETAAYLNLMKPGEGARYGRWSCSGVGLSPVEAPNVPGGDLPADGDVCATTFLIEAVHGEQAAWTITAAAGPDGPELLWEPPGIGP